MRLRAPAPTVRILAVAAVVVAGLGGCGGSDDPIATTTTLLPDTSLTVPGLTPDEAFDQALTDQLDGIDAAFVGGSRAAGHTLCDNLAALTGDESTTGTDDPTPALLIGTVFDGFTQPAVAAVVLRATGEHLCPAHLEAIEQVLATKGQ